MPAEIREISVNEASELQRGGVALIDVRDAHEHALGIPAGARTVPRALLERDAAGHADASQALVLICGTGKRSMLAAQVLAGQGFHRLYSVAGGFDAWQAAGLPVDGMGEDGDFVERYSRHLRLPQVGLDGQRVLRASRVLLVGAGGLGSPAALYLAAAGVGFLRIVDNDLVERSNLQRQVLHTDDRIGQSKVSSAQGSLQALNPSITIDARAVRLEATNVEALVSDVDLVLDGSDNFPTRYLLSDACVRLAKPLVHGAVHRFEGQVSVFDAGRHRGIAPCYRCLFPQAPRAEDAPNCAEAGVLGVLPGIIGMLQACEVLKLLLGIGEPLVGRLLHFDALAMRFRETRLRPDPDCPVCAPGADFSGYGSLQQACNAS